jgi:hypothetical protein
MIKMLLAVLLQGLLLLEQENDFISIPRIVLESDDDVCESTAMVEFRQWMRPYARACPSSQNRVCLKGMT